MYYIKEASDDGRVKIGNTAPEKAGIIEYATVESLKDDKRSIYGYSRKTGKAVKKEITQYQELDWGECRVISFVNEATDKIHICVENKETYEILYGESWRRYLDTDIESCMEPKDGELEVIFEQGRETKCIGVCIWLEYKCINSDKCNPITLELYMELHNGEIKYIHSSSDWEFKECGTQYIYDEENDRITTEFIPAPKY